MNSTALYVICFVLIASNFFWILRDKFQESIINKYRSQNRELCDTIDEYISALNEADIAFTELRKERNGT